MMGLFDDIRTACRTVAERAEFVRIDYSRIESYARSLPLKEVAAPSLDPAHHYLGGSRKTLAFILSLDAINFGSGWFPHVKKRPWLSGYMTVATSLKEWFESRDAVGPEDLMALTPADCARILGQEPLDDRPAVAELMALFAQAMNDLGRLVLDRYGGRFGDLLDAADHSAETLVSLLQEMPFYRDVHRYGDLVVPLYKRAQITAADLSVAFRDHKWGRFDDIANLTIFADNLVPHVLRMDGLLQFDPDLLARIHREEPIPSGSPEEIEIRACGLTAVELLLDALRASGVAVIARDLDYFLWNRGQQPRYKAEPRHRTPCVYY